MPGGLPRKKTQFRGTGALFAQRSVARAAKTDEAVELNNHLPLTMPTENGQTQENPVTREGPRRTEAVSDRGARGQREGRPCRLEGSPDDFSQSGR